MNAIPEPGAPGVPRRELRAPRLFAGLLASALLVTSFQASTQEPVPAVWQPRKISFSYSSQMTLFSCSALAARVAVILRAVGARDDVRVRANGCTDGIPPQPAHASDRMTVGAWDPLSERATVRGQGGPQRVSVYAQLMLPTEITPAVLDELEKDKTRRELVARVTGNPAARFNDPVKFSAQWQPVTLSSKTIGLTTDECELLEQMSPGVFRKLGMRVVSSGVVCSAGSHVPPQVVVQALLPTPYPSGAPSPPQPAGNEDTDPAAPATSDDEDAAGGDEASTNQ
jgi:hypothetical protein